MYVEDASNCMEVGNICVYVGQETSAYTGLVPRVVYRVISRDNEVGTATWCRYRYGLQPVFDIAGREGVGSLHYCVIGTRFLKKLGLIELCLLRMQLDDFIMQHAVDLSRA